MDSVLFLGLSGNETILDIGGPAFLLPLVKKDKIYDLRPLPKLVNDKECFVIGAGAGPWPYAETNCEVCKFKLIRRNSFILFIKYSHSYSV